MPSSRRETHNLWTLDFWVEGKRDLSLPGLLILLKSQVEVRLETEDFSPAEIAPSLKHVLVRVITRDGECLGEAHKDLNSKLCRLMSNEDWEHEEQTELNWSTKMLRRVQKDGQKDEYDLQFWKIQDFPRNQIEPLSTSKLFLTPQSAWLQALRSTFSRLVHQFETQCLPVAIQSIDEDSNASLTERYEMSYLALDDRLESPPLQLLPPGWRNGDHEWVYTVDLDQEIFSIDNAVHLRLSSIASDQKWILYLGKDARRRRAPAKWTPPHVLADPTFKPQVKETLIKMFNRFKVEVVAPESFYLSQDISFLRESFLASTFTRFQGHYRDLLDGSYLEWSPTDFPFREIAYAIVSLATGAVSFASPGSLDANHKKEGYYLVHGEKSSYSEFLSLRPTLLPRFLHESHHPGVGSGSAPRQTTYWSDSVLVHLVTGLDRVDIEEAAIAEAVEAGLEQGRKSFYAIVFSILDVILLRVQAQSDLTILVERSPIMTLFEFDDTNSSFARGPRNRSPRTLGNVKDSKSSTKSHQNSRSNDLARPNGHDCQLDDTNQSLTVRLAEEMNYSIVFVTLLRFFDAATYHDLEGAVSHVLPNETLATVMQLTDARTYRSLSKLSAYCRKTSLSELRLNDHYTIVEFDLHSTSYTLVDRRTGTQSTTRLCRGGFMRCYKDLVLTPIIGIEDPSRPSIIDSVQWHLVNVPSGDAPYTKTVTMPRRAAYDRLAYPGFAPSINFDMLFHLPDHLYVGSVEEGWDRYLKKLIRRYQDEEDSPGSSFDTGLFDCVRPPGYREITMDAFRCSGFHCFLRRARDESVEEWVSTMQYALRRLHVREGWGSGYEVEERLPLPGRPVVVAFSARVGLFYYVHHRREKPEAPAGVGKHSIEIAERCTDPDLQGRLVPLIPGVIDLRDYSSRVEFESWFERFCHGVGEKTVYDPFTDQQQPLTRVPEPLPHLSKQPMTSTEPVGSDVVYDLPSVYRSLG
ncbi:hypothetical protein BO82DRAFT_399674 [Aspergillus uvarum CBS 121591]|uniref:Uncharacterized protein n=1 Tax=Aspergillus uvarum CBS 121591 TaxID=1448315 RepID=A0A319CJ04_9EURO|nr:hypothetical protein BO82DRAFT_399674 [Aspergillus uvarum CBS 121591]PYH84430.1 hypothetical protein BO82DRAFT_399674 [Aspergillus uvarum CBS 121591]